MPHGIEKMPKSSSPMCFRASFRNPAAYCSSSLLRSWCHLSASSDSFSFLLSPSPPPSPSFCFFYVWLAYLEPVGNAGVEPLDLGHSIGQDVHGLGRL